MDYKILIIIIILFPFVDFFYLNYMSDHFKELVLTITKEKMVFNYTKAIIAYIFLILALYYFILYNIDSQNLYQKIQDAVVLGLVIYGTYDFTNGAIFKDYDYKTSVIDTIWGATLFGLITILSYNIKNLI